MNYKLSLAALAIAATVSGQAMADISVLQKDALIAAATGLDIAWLTDTDGGGTNWQGLDTDAATQTTLNTNADTAWDSTVDACTWAGVVCDVTDNTLISHLEIPNTGMTGGVLADLVTALTPFQTSLKVLNLSHNGAGTASDLGAIPSEITFPLLTHFAINKSSVTGEVPDLSSSSDLEFVNIGENPGITGIAGGLGGPNLDELFIFNNPAIAMTGDLTTTLEASKDSLTVLDVRGSGLTGQVPDYANNTATMRFQISGTNLYGDFTITNTGSGLIDIQGTGVLPADPTTDVPEIGYVAADAVQPAAGIVAMAGTVAGELEATPTAVTGGSADAYLVSYSSDAGVTFSTPVNGTAGVATTFDGLATGDYVARVQAQNSTTLAVSSPVDSTPAVTITAATITCADGETLNTATNECDTDEVEEEEEEESTSSGGGAALWLVLLPLMGLLRRKSV